MRGGDLRHRVLIESKALTTDANGDRTETWTTYHECYADIATGNGREYFAAKQTIADISHTVRIRYKAGITPDMRVRFNDLKNSGSARYYNIRSVGSPDERSEQLALQCTEVLI